MHVKASLIIACQLVGTAALADPYPFSGYFALQTPEQPQANCAFDVLHQSRDGTFSGYLLDRRHWGEAREPRFLRYKFGTCTYDAAQRTDNCTAEQNHISGVKESAPDRARITVIDADTVGMLTLGPGDDPANPPDLPPFVFVRCPFKAETIAPLLLDGVAGYSPTELADMARSRDPEETAAVLKFIAERDRIPD
jgi:hypothetical protein